jgi:hypothetical protein
MSVGGPGRAAGEILTSGQAARLLGVAPQSIANWMGRGDLIGYRLPARGGKPGSRRIRRADLAEFAASIGFFGCLGRFRASDGRQLYAASLQDRWGEPAVRLTPEIGEAGGPARDWLPGGPTRYEVKAGADEVVERLRAAGFAFNDSR